MHLNVTRRYKWAFHPDYAAILLEDDARPDLELFDAAPERALQVRTCLLVQRSPLTEVTYSRDPNCFTKQQGYSTRLQSLLPDYESEVHKQPRLNIVQTHSKRRARR